MRGVVLLLLVVLHLLPSGGAAQRRVGLSRRGLETLRQATLVDSVDAETQFRYGLGLWERHQYDAADSALRRALRFAPWHPGAHLALGGLPFGRGERFLFDLRTRLGPDSLEAWSRGVAHHSRTAFLNDPLIDLASLRFVDLDELVPVSGGLGCTGGTCVPTARGSRWPAPTRNAVRVLLQGRPDSAYTLLIALLDSRRPEEWVPDDVIWYFALAADRTGHPAEAAEGFRELAQRTGRRERTGIGRATMTRERDLLLLFYGMASYRAGSVAVARAALREALLVDLTLYQAHSRLAEIAEAQGDVEEAITERRAAIAIAPEIGRLHVDLGITLLQAGRTLEAKETLTEAVAIAPWDPAAQLFLFQTAMTLKDRPAAAAALAELERFAPARNREQVAEARTRLAELP